MKKRYVFVLIIFLIICVIAGGFVYKKITSKQIQNITGNLEINKEKVNEIEKREWRESEESHPFKVLPDPNEKGEVVNRTWEEIWENARNGYYNQEPVNIDRIQKLYICVSTPYADMTNVELGMAVNFDEGGFYRDSVWWYYDEGLTDSISQDNMNEIKNILKNHIYGYDWKYEYDDDVEVRDIATSEVDTEYTYQIILVDEYGKMEIYRGCGRVPNDFEDFLNEMSTLYDSVMDSMVDKTLKEYFQNPKSDGSYLIADCIVSKVAGTATKNTNSKGYTYSIETPYEDNVRQCKKKLDKLEKKGVYNKEKNEINIKDINNLSEDEYDAILIVTTGNPDAYSYAAENQYHADMLDKYGQLWKSHTISSDAGVGESMFANLYESDFKDTDGETYREQKKYHK